MTLPVPPVWTNPDPLVHHPYCQFYRGEAECTCADGKRTNSEMFFEEVGQALRNALASERRATVQRIREQVIKTVGGADEVPAYLFRIFESVER